MKPTSILCGDIHLREDNPQCRTDNFWEVQWEKIKWLKALSEKYDCPVWHAGDLFHRWKASPLMITNCIRHFPKDFWTVIGNHDLPQHQMENFEKSGLQTLVEGGHVNLFEAGHWGFNPKDGGVSWEGENRKVLVWHKFVYIGKEPWPDCTEQRGYSVFDNYPEYDLIVTGDNHKPFVIEEDGRLLVNVGSFTRQEADQMDYEPQVYLYYAETNEIERVPVPINKDVISNAHLAKVTEREARLESFISKVNGDWAVSVNFEHNVHELLRKNKDIPERVKEIIINAIEN